MDWSRSNRAAGGMAEDPNDILVFGYACKLFRDDDKAQWIDEEHHLIPWMGSSDVTIDRYDGRGALMEMDISFSSGVGDQGGAIDPLEAVPNVRGLEALLDEERYKDLREDSEFDDLNYQEVEFRKFQCDVNGAVVAQNHNNYAAIGYSYDDAPSNSNTNNDIDENLESAGPKLEEDVPFVLPPGLMLPPNMTFPTTMKSHSIIEKTAKFIASHGSQMEIILKTKQSGNPSFNFLDYKDALNPYFKSLVQAIRSNTYVPSEEINTEDTKKASSSDAGSDSDDDGYLHPSLFRASTDSPPTIPHYVSTGGPNAYSLLVSKIRASEPPPPPPPIIVNTTTNGTNSELTRPQNQVPGENDQLVIEKMASYVVKNGIAFEELAKTKGDVRFVFLNPTHQFHWYYLNCKERFKAETDSVVASSKFVSYAESAAAAAAEKKKKFTNPPVVQLPLSASGIPIANLASISSRPTTIPPEVQNRIELIKKKNSLFAKKDTLSAKIQFSSTIGKGLQLGNEPNSSSMDDNTSIEIQDKIEAEKVVDENGVSSSLTLSLPENTSESEIERLKQLRRQKAALFLQKINAKPKEVAVTNQIITTTTINSSDDSPEVEEIPFTPPDVPVLTDLNVMTETAKVVVAAEKVMLIRRSRSRSNGRYSSGDSRSSPSSRSKRGNKKSSKKSSRKKKRSHSHTRSRSSSRSRSTKKKSKRHKR